MFEIINYKSFKMKKSLIILISLFSIGLSAQGSITETEKSELLAKSPFNSIYPTSILKSADKYFEEAQMPLYSQGAIDEKNAHLVGLAVSASTKCKYCIPYHIAELKRLGASEEEIKTAVMIAADIMKMSTLFYGNEFDLDEFKALLK
ncbi:MAG: hypothetical protein CBD60_03540 [Flavobacteriaceae bacterium TMED200]|nr:MAG: hypothetical protein CBD60_03540 [Flavobacteriaceae bacterium TMED200]|tara:strand:- start:145 stop:588 length:444 start_codon:yes stop_codon:yes gene_type:complete